MTGPSRAYVIPWLTAVLLGIVIVIFALEQHYGLEPAGANMAPTTKTLLAFGGLSARLVQQGEIYRMLAAPFLHGSLRHLEADALVIAVAGYGLERRVGRAWLSCIFAAGGLAGSVMALLVAGSEVTAGGSGGAAAMVTASLLSAFRMADREARLRTWLLMAVALWVVLFPLTQGRASHVDFGATLGGAILGIMLGGLLLATWWEDEELPSFQLPAAGLSAAAAVSSAIIGYAVVARFP